MAAEISLRLPETSSTSSAAGTMRLKCLIKLPAQSVVLDSVLLNFIASIKVGYNGRGKWESNKRIYSYAVKT